MFRKANDIFSAKEIRELSINSSEVGKLIKKAAKRGDFTITVSYCISLTLRSALTKSGYTVSVNNYPGCPITTTISW